MAVRHHQDQRGAALLIVLLLTATLAFIVLGVAESLSHSMQRTAGASNRSELLWRAMSLEVVAREAILEADRLSTDQGVRYTRDHPLFATTFPIPAEGGGGLLRFADASQCFNVNSLVTQTEDGTQTDETAVLELVEILKALGLGNADGQRIARVVADWIDDDNFSDVRGSEDGYYASLPTPYRTGRTQIAAISELRAMNGVTRSVYETIRPFLCAAPNPAPMTINVNMLEPSDAPLVVGLTAGAASSGDAREAIEARPPGGWANIEEFWAHRAFSDLEIDESFKQRRTAVRAKYIDVIGQAAVNDIEIAVRLRFATLGSNGDIRLVSRELGADL
ncbi:MAG: type II secretion system minor pseudopilin GspK [Pseudomonadota bacterium]